MHKNLKLEDGLTKYNILNNIDGQGKFLWFFDKKNVSENLVVGLSDDNTIIIKNGNYISGIIEEGYFDYKFSNFSNLSNLTFSGCTNHSS
jgi:hypothetical protein